MAVVTTKQKPNVSLQETPVHDSLFASSIHADVTVNAPNGAIWFYVQMSTDESFTAPVMQQSTNNILRFDNLSYNTQYWFRSAASDDNRNISGWSDVATVTTTDESMDPATPTAFTVDVVDLTDDDIVSTEGFYFAWAWSRGNGPASKSFEIEVSDSIDSTTFIIPAGKTDSYQSIPKKGATYSAKMRAVSYGGRYSDWTSVVSNITTDKTTLSTSRTLTSKVELNDTGLYAYESSQQTFKLGADGTFVFGTGTEAITFADGVLSVPAAVVGDTLTAKTVVVDPNSGGGVKSSNTETFSNGSGFYIGKEGIRFGSTSGEYLSYNVSTQTLSLNGSATLDPSTTLPWSQITNTPVGNGAWEMPVAPTSNPSAYNNGLNLTSSYLGYYNGTTWKSYMDNQGRFYLGGESGALQWNGTSLTITGSIHVNNPNDFADVNANNTYIDANGKLQGVSSGANTLVDNSLVKVGGVNLVKHSGDFTADRIGSGKTWQSTGQSVVSLDTAETYNSKPTLKVEGTSVSSHGGAINTHTMRIEPETEYVVSGIVKANHTKVFGATTDRYLHIQVWTTENTTNVHQETILDYNQDVTTEWRQVYMKFKTPASSVLVFCRFYIWPLIGGETVNVAHVQIEKGNTVSSWSPSKMDVDETIAIAKAAADAAKAAADDAQDAADAAQVTANNVTSTVGDIISDNMLDPAEKQAIKQEWDVIVEEKAGILAQADYYEITTEKTTYTNTFQALADYLNNSVTWVSGTPNWLSDLSTSTAIVGPNFRAYFTNFYKARTALFQKIADKTTDWAYIQGLNRPADNADVTVENIAGRGVNIMHPSYSFWAESALPTIHKGSNVTVARDTANAYYGSGCLRASTTNVNSNILVFSTSDSEYLIPIAPNKKWLVSMYVKAASNAAVAISTKTSNGVIQTYSPNKSVGTSYSRISHVVDLTSNNSIAMNVHLYLLNASINYYIDAIMVEELVGNQITPSAYSRPDATVALMTAGYSVSTGALRFTDSAGANQMVLDGVDKSVWIKSNTFGNEGIQLQYNNGTPRAFIGNNTNYLKWDGSSLTIAGSITAIKPRGVYNNVPLPVANRTVNIPCYVNVTDAGTGWFLLYEHTIQRNYDATSVDGNFSWGGSEGRFNKAAKVRINLSAGGSLSTLHLAGYAIEGEDCSNNLKAYHKVEDSKLVLRIYIHAPFYWTSYLLDGSWSLFAANTTGTKIKDYHQLTSTVNDTVAAPDGTWTEIMPNRTYQIGANRTTVSNTAPSTPNNGEMWFDTGANKTKYWDGDSWEIIEDKDIAIAQTAANNAQTTANSVTATVNDITSDSQFTPNEKADIRREWNVISAEKSDIDTQATSFGITTEKTNYGTKFQALATYLNNGTNWTSGVPIWINDSNLSTTTSITGSTFRTKFTEFYTTRTTLLQKIADETAKRAMWINVTGDSKPQDYATKTGDTNFINPGYGSFESLKLEMGWFMDSLDCVGPALTNEDAYSGDQCLKLINNRSPQQGGGIGAYFTKTPNTDKFPLKLLRNRRWLVTFWAKASIANPTLAAQMRIDDESTDGLFWPPSLVSVSKTSAANTWIQFAIVLDLTAKSESRGQLRIVCTNATTTGDTCYIDNVVLHDVTNQPNLNENNFPEGFIQDTPLSVEYIGGTKAQTVESNANTAFTGTVSLRSASAPNPTTMSFGTISSAQTPDGNVVVTVPYSFTQGTIKADSLLIYVDEGGNGVTEADPAFQTNAVTGSMKFTLTPSTVYRFGIQAIRKHEGGIVGTNITASSQITTLAAKFTGIINNTPASTVELNAANASVDAAVALGFNPIFEDWTNASSPPNGWLKTGSFTLSRETTTKSTGSYSVKMVTDNTISYKYIEKLFSFTGSPFQTGTVVSGTVAIRVGSVTGNGKPGIKVRLYRTTSTSSNFTDTNVAADTGMLGVWQTLTFDATVAEDQRIHAIRIFLMGAASNESGFGSAPFNGTVYFDRLTLSIGKNAIQYFNNGALSSATRLPSDLNYISVGADAVDVTGITAPSTFTGLYLGNNKMGYVAGNPSLAASWKTYMDHQGSFFLGGHTAFDPIDTTNNPYFDSNKTGWTSSQTGQNPAETTVGTIVAGVGDWGVSKNVLRATVSQGNSVNLGKIAPFPVALIKSYFFSVKVKLHSLSWEDTNLKFYPRIKAGVVQLRSNYTTYGSPIWFAAEDISFKTLGEWKVLSSKLDTSTLNAEVAFLRPFIILECAYNDVFEFDIDGLVFYENFNSIQLEYNSGDPRMYAGDALNYIKFTKDEGLEISGNLTGSSYVTSKYGKRIEINKNNNNEIHIYGDPNTGYIQEVATIGINTVGNDYVIANFGSETSDATAVRGESDKGTAIVGISFFDAGIYGSSARYIGVIGHGTGYSPTGVIGVKGIETSSSGGIGVFGESNVGIGGVFKINSGGKAQVRLHPAPSGTTRPTASTALRGAFFVENNGDLYYCNGSNWKLL